VNLNSEGKSSCCVNLQQKTFVETGGGKPSQENSKAKKKKQYQSPRNSAEPPWLRGGDTKRSMGEKSEGCLRVWWNLWGGGGLGVVEKGGRKSGADSMFLLGEMGFTLHHTPRVGIKRLFVGEKSL